MMKFVVRSVATLFTATTLVGCVEELPDAPSKEQVVKYVQGHVGSDATILWYIPYKPETQSHGSTSQPVRSFAMYSRDGFCFLYDFEHSQRTLVSCEMAAPKTAVKP